MKDRFSDKAREYQQYRPDYPRAIIDYIISHCKGRQHAWDCATGNGQTAVMLSSHFEKVFATDLSEKQLKEAVERPGIFYSIRQAESPGFPDDYFDLITVSQAIHWFNFKEFYAQVVRVARDEAIIAVWCYSLLKINPEVDQVIKTFYTDVIGEFWDEERKYVDMEYRSIPFPFEEIPAPIFYMDLTWTLSQLEGYIGTWSAVRKFITGRETNPVPGLIAQVRPLLNEQEIAVRFPLHLRLGRVKK